MKNKLSDWEWLSIRILMIGLTVFLWSFITDIEGIHGLFGDTYYNNMHWRGEHWSWGFRHYVYTITFTIITAVQVVRVIKWVYIKSENKGFKIKK